MKEFAFKKLSDETKAFFVTEQPGDVTRYTFIMFLSSSAVLPNSAYDILIIPTKDDGVTVIHPFFWLKQNVLDIVDKMNESVIGKSFDNADSCRVQASAISDMANRIGEDPFTLASAYRCAYRLIKLGADVQ